VGTAINTDKLKNEEKYWQLALSQFNSFTPEKVMKPRYLHPTRELYNFNEADHLADFCRENKIRLHGHTLVWHKALPEWMAEFNGSPAEWEAIFREHIQSVVGHYWGSVKSWDVVNEAFNDDGTLRKNIWLKHIGESYIEKAFRYAGMADPDALLFYNDYSLERNGDKLMAVLEWLNRIRLNGVAVHGIGMQMHVSLEYPAIGDINQAALNVQQNGYLVHYSEVDISLSAGQSLFASRKKLENLQKDRIRLIVEGYMKLKPEKRFGITLWGISDNDSWLMEEHFRSRPLLFSTRYKIKPAYCGFVEALDAGQAP
jgi:endo-1,4-beta-xylanase